jgi:hypothetical protein
MLGACALLGAASADAEEPIRLDLDMYALSGLESPRSTSETTEDGDQRFSLDLADRFIWDAEYSEALRLAIWDSPMGRPEYELALSQRGLGMSGMVGAGSSFPIFARFAVRDTMTPRLVLSNGWQESWHELSTDQRVQVGVEAAVAAGVLWGLIEGLSH